MSSPSQEAGAAAAYSLGMSAAAAGASAAEIGSWLDSIGLPAAPPAPGPDAPYADQVAGLRAEAAAAAFERGFTAETGNITAGLAELEAAEAEAQAEPEAEA